MPGFNLENIKELHQLVLKHHPQVVVLYAGDNDIATGKRAEQVAHDYRAFVASIQALPETKIVFIAIKPSIARWKLASAMRRANILEYPPLESI